MRFITTRVHGLLDYTSVVTLLALPRLLGWRPAVRQLMTGAALSTLLYSLMTRYELGVVKILPMKAHLTLDGIGGLLFCAAPILLEEEDVEAAGALFGIGVFELGAALLSKTVADEQRTLAARVRNYILRAALLWALMRKLRD